MRSRRFDRYVLDFLIKYPDSTIINLGCGLDTRFYVQTMESNMVRYWFPWSDRTQETIYGGEFKHHFIEDSILSPEWIVKVRTGGPYLILLKCFYVSYWIGCQRTFIQDSQRFGFCRYCVWSYNSLLVDKMKSRYMQWKFKQQLGMTGSAVFTFGIPYSRYFEQWSTITIFLMNGPILTIVKENWDGSTCFIHWDPAQSAMDNSLQDWWLKL